MAVTVRRAEERGGANLGWLDTKHTFSFGQYFDPNFVGFGPLRVINEDRVAPGGGFPSHPHRDMEILTYVVAGALDHRDSLGTGSVIEAGDVQRISAGTGIRHSEYNASRVEPVHFLQIWIEPEHEGLAPSYDQRSFRSDVAAGRLRLIGSRDGRMGSITIHQDVDILVSTLDVAEKVEHSLMPGRGAWVQVVSGSVHVNNEILVAGDGASITTPGPLALTGNEGGSEVLLFDLPP